MSGFELDMDRVKRVLAEATADPRVMSQRKLSRLAAGERGRDAVGDILKGRNKNPTVSLLASIAAQLGGDLSMFGLPVGLTDADTAGSIDEQRLIALLPSEAELERMLSDTQASLPPSLPASEIPRAVAAGLRQRLELLLRDRSNAGSAGRRAGRARKASAQAPAPTNEAGRA